MKKWLLFYLTVAFALAGCAKPAMPAALSQTQAGGTAWAEDAPAKPGEREFVDYGEKDGFHFNIYSDDTITITGCVGDAPSDLVIPASIDGYRTTGIGFRAFLLEALRTAVLPATLETIEEKAFEECASLREVHLPEGLLSIGSNAFDGCRSLSTLHIPASVREIGINAFPMFIDNGYFALQVTENSPYFRVVDNVLFSKDMTQLIAYYPTDYRTEYTVPEEVTTIGRNAFALGGLADELHSIRLGEQVSYVCGSAFPGASPLLIIPEENPYLLMEDSAIYNSDRTLLMEYIPFYRFNEYGSYDHDATIQYLVPDGVTQIGDYAFESDGMADVFLPESVKSIGKYAFSDNPLTKIDLPDAISRIEEGTFHMCSHLEHVRFPASLTYIGDSAFTGAAIADLILPDGVTHIGKSAFHGVDMQTLRLPRGAYRDGRSRV